MFADPKNKTAAVPASVVTPIRKIETPSDHAARTRAEKLLLEGRTQSALFSIFLPEGFNETPST